jgi:anti-anti-sigma factor
VKAGAATGVLHRSDEAEVIEGVALLEVKQDVREAAVILSAEGEIDSGTVDTLITHLDAALEAGAEHSSRIVVLEFRDVTYFGSAGLNAVLGCYEKGRADGVAVRLVASNAEVIMPIEVTKLDTVLKPYPSVADALAGSADGSDEPR